MARTTTDRLKFNPPVGNLPALQYLLPQQLQIDESYQRSIETSDSQALVRKIAQHWNWDLCQPLVVARRPDGGLYVIDGQHRLAAARLRGDIAQLPAVVVQSECAADEAASFVFLNQQRRPLTGIQVFHAAIASGYSEACAIRDEIEAAGLKLGRHGTLQLAPPMTIINVAGIQGARRKYGPAVAREALEVLATAFAGQRLVYAGTLYGGIAAICASEMGTAGRFEPSRFAVFTAMLGGRTQADWRRDVLTMKAETPNLTYSKAGEMAIGGAWRKRMAPPLPKPVPPAPASIRPAAPPPRPEPIRATPPGKFDASGKTWCDQCEMRVTQAQAVNCKSRFCSVKKVA